MEALPSAFFEAVVELSGAGTSVVIVHGGGPAINGMLEKLQIPPRFHDGLRVTCEETLQVVEMMLTGSVNKQLVRRIRQAGGSAWGISGEDAGLITAVPTSQPLGLVGEIQGINTSAIRAILAQGCIPVIAPVGMTEDGAIALNINADVAAGAIAAALGAKRLLLVTDVPGILVPDGDGGRTLAERAGPRDIRQWIEAGVITGGMIPKVQSALAALEQGVHEVVIVKGTAEDLLAAAAGGRAGTAICRDDGVPEETRKGVATWS